MFNFEHNFGKLFLNPLHTHFGRFLAYKSRISNDLFFLTESTTPEYVDSYA